MLYMGSEFVIVQEEAEVIILFSYIQWARRLLFTDNKPFPFPDFYFLLVLLQFKVRRRWDFPKPTISSRHPTQQRNQILKAAQHK